MNWLKKINPKRFASWRKDLQDEIAAFPPNPYVDRVFTVMQTVDTTYWRSGASMRSALVELVTYMVKQEADISMLQARVDALEQAAKE